MYKTNVPTYLNVFGVKAVYIQPFHKPIGAAGMPRRPRALKVVARKYERIDPRVDYYSTPSRIAIVNCLNLSFCK